MIELMQRALARPGGARDQDVGHLAQVHDHGLARDVATNGDVEWVLGGQRLLRGEQVTQRDERALAVRHLDADGGTSGDRGQDADVGRGHGVGDVLVERRDARHLDAGAELELEARDRRADGVADEGRVDTVGAERLDQFGAQVLDSAAVLPLLLGAQQQRRRGQPPLARHHGLAVGQGHDGRQHRSGLAALVVLALLPLLVLVLVLDGLGDVLLDGLFASAFGGLLLELAVVGVAGVPDVVLGTHRPPPRQARSARANQRDRAGVERAEPDARTHHDRHHEQRQQHDQRAGDADGPVAAHRPRPRRASHQRARAPCSCRAATGDPRRDARCRRGSRVRARSPSPAVARSTSILPTTSAAPRPSSITGSAKRPTPNATASDVEIARPTGPSAPASARATKSPTTTSSTIHRSRSWRCHTLGASDARAALHRPLRRFLLVSCLCHNHPTYRTQVRKARHWS